MLRLIILLTLIYAQDPIQPIRRQPVVVDEFSINRPSNSPTSITGEEYRIGKDDLIEVSVFEVPDLGGVSRVSASGFISLPLSGSILAIGKTPQELEAIVEESLKAKFINDPHATVFIREYASQPVSVLGAVKVPGIYQLKGQKYLLDMIAMAQGLGPTAGKTIQVIRRRSGDDSDAQVISVNAQDLLDSGRSELNIRIQANDSINVVEAGSIFVVGEVNRPGEYVLRQGRDVTATQALAYGGGFTREAKKKEVLVIHPNDDGTRQERMIDLQKVLDGSEKDVAMSANDILFIPANKAKNALNKALDSVISVAIGRAVYAR